SGGMPAAAFRSAGFATPEVLEKPAVSASRHCMHLAVALFAVEVDDPFVASSGERFRLSIAPQAFSLRPAGRNELDIDPADGAEVGNDRVFGDGGNWSGIEDPRLAITDENEDLAPPVLGNVEAQSAQRIPIAGPQVKPRSRSQRFSRRRARRGHGDQ